MQAIANINGISGNAIVSKAGKVVGSRRTFTYEGTMTATEVRAQLKSEGLKGRDLTRKVNEVLTGKRDVSWARFEAGVSVLRSNGYIPDYLDARKTGASARFVKPKSVTEGVTKDEALEVLAREKKMKLEELRAMLGL